MALGITLVICTYNGATMLPETIKHIAAQQAEPDMPWEVIIVDNASTDGTSEVITREWENSRCTVPFTLLSQPKPGLTFARELALSQARYEFILFCDDDNWLYPGYVSLAYQLMLQHPQVGILGGSGEAVFEVPPPYWATKLNLFAVGSQAPTSGKVTNNVVYGAGCIIRKSAYEKVLATGFRSMLTDRKGNSLSSGGDYELCYAIALAGYDVWYDERLKFKHFMPQKRINIAYYKRYFADNAKSFDVLMPYRIRVNMGAKNLFLFYLMLFKILLSYTCKLYIALLKSLLLSIDSEVHKANLLYRESLKYKVQSFKRINAMKRNFLNIRKYEQDEQISKTAAGLHTINKTAV